VTSRSTGMYAEMAAALFSSDVLQTIYGPIPEETNLPLAVQPDVVAYFDVLILAQSNFEEWLRVWRMDVSERNANNNGLLAFARQQKQSFLI